MTETDQDVQLGSFVSAIGAACEAGFTALLRWLFIDCDKCPKLFDAYADRNFLTQAVRSGEAAIPLLQLLFDYARQHNTQLLSGALEQAILTAIRRRYFSTARWLFQHSPSPIRFPVIICEVLQAYAAVDAETEAEWLLLEHLGKKQAQTLFASFRSTNEQLGLLRGLFERRTLSVAQLLFRFFPTTIDVEYDNGELLNQQISEKRLEACVMLFAEGAALRPRHALHVDSDFFRECAASKPINIKLRQQLWQLVPTLPYRQKCTCLMNPIFRHAADAGLLTAEAINEFLKTTTSVSVLTPTRFNKI